MTFDFSIYTIPLLVTQVIYFRSELGNLEGGKLPEGGEVYCY